MQAVESTARRARHALVQTLRKHAHRLAGNDGDYDELMRIVGNARFALLGEASHGTREYYRERIRITKRFIEEIGFLAIASDFDWPDTLRVNNYVRVHSQDKSAD